MADLTVTLQPNLTGNGLSLNAYSLEANPVAFDNFKGLAINYLFPSQEPQYNQC